MTTPRKVSVPAGDPGDGRRVDAAAPSSVATALGRPFAAVLVSLALLLGLLTVSGLLLAVAYRPPPRPVPPGWEPAPRPELWLPDAVIAVTVNVHRVAGFLALAVGVVFLGLAVRRAVRRTLAGLVVGSLVAALVSGLLLPWDALALWAGHVGQPLGHGYLWVLGPAVRLALQGNAALTPSAMLWRLVVHIGVATAAIVVAARLLAALRVATRQASE
jgi:hypothetical protein